MPSDFGYAHTHKAFFTKHGQRFDFAKDQHFIRADDPTPQVFFLDSGIVESSFYVSDGTKRVIGYFVPGLTFAQNRSFFENDGGGLDYRTITPCTMFRVHRDIFLKRLTKDHEFGHDYTQMLLRSQVFMVERSMYQGEADIYHKTLHWLLFMIKYYGQTSDGSIKIIIPLTQDAIGHLLGASRESISKCIRQLVRKKLITIEKKHIYVVDALLLRAELEH